MPLFKGGDIVDKEHHRLTAKWMQRGVNVYKRLFRLSIEEWKKPDVLSKRACSFIKE